MLQTVFAAHQLHFADRACLTSPMSHGLSCQATVMVYMLRAYNSCHRTYVLRDAILLVPLHVLRDVMLLVPVHERKCSMRELRLSCVSHACVRCLQGAKPAEESAGASDKQPAEYTTAAITARRPALLIA